MYIDGYIDRKSGVLHVAERINGRRILVQHAPVYEFYAESPNGQYKTITGTLANKHTFTRHSEMKAMLKNMGNVRTFESDCDITFKSLAKYYMDDTPPELHKVLFDIETGFDNERGFAPADDPFNKITAFSVYQSWTDEAYVLVIPPEEMPLTEAKQYIKELQDENPSAHIILFDTEKHMIEYFLDLIEDADVLSGWNSEFFDIPYVVNRIRLIYNDAMTTRLCLWGKKPIAREVDNYGKTTIVYDLVGRVHLDYLALYKKHAGSVAQSYKLDDIGYIEVKENKIEYDGTLDALYRNNFKIFVQYSLQDTVLLKKLDAKLDYINLHNRLAHQECVLLKTTMGSVALIDTAIANHSHTKGMIVFDKPAREEEYSNDMDYSIFFENDDDDDEPPTSAKAAGAWVQDPVTGIHDDIGVVDFNSLYPTTLRSLNMSTECIVGQLRQTYTDAHLNAKIDAQRIKAKNSSTFEPDWTAAWHGLFASIEFTKVHEKSDDTIFVDLEDGQSFECSGAELHDMIFGPDSTLILSANGTLFDKNKDGIIPGILTMWYDDRKLMQKASLDFYHLSTDGINLLDEKGFNLTSEELTILTSVKPNHSGLRHTNLGDECEVFLIRKLLKERKLEEASELVSKLFIIENGHLHSLPNDKAYCKDQAAFWKQQQQIRKILLNSLYGALLNKGSRFFDKRLGQSTTLSGRTMCEYMASTINKVVGEEPVSHGGAIIYGDTDSVYFSVSQAMKLRGEEFNLSRDEVVDLYIAIGEQVGDTFPDFMNDKFNTGIERGKLVGADLEMVGSRGIFLKKKRYAILKYWEDGIRLDTKGSPGKPKILGLEIKRSDTSKYIQVFLEDVLVSLLSGKTEAELKQKVLDFKKVFHDMKSHEKGSPKTVKKLSHWSEVYEKTGKCSVGHVLSAIQWNKLRKLNGDMTVPSATDGTKVMVCLLQPNPLGIKSIGYPIECKEYLPDWFLKLPFDDVEMEQKVLTKKLSNIFGTVEMDLGINEKTTANDDNGFFEW